MSDPTPTLPAAGTALEVLTFGMGGETFALDAVLVRDNGTVVRVIQRSFR